MKINDNNVKKIIQKTIKDLERAYGRISRESCDRDIREATARLESLIDIIDWQ